MRKLGLVLVAAITIVAFGPGCRSRAYVRSAAPPPAAGSGGVYVVESPPPQQVQPQYGQPGYGQQDVYGQGQGQVQVQGQAQGQMQGQAQLQGQLGAQLLYLPVEAAMLPLHLIQAVYVQTDDGRQFQITQADVTQGLGGRVAVRIPAGVTTGTATVYLTTGQQWSTTFHIAASGGGQGVVASGPVGDPRCQLPQGTWQGTISDDPNSSATVWLEVLGDCRTVRGYVHLDSASGSVDSTIEGTWDVGSYTLSARDTQLFNMRAMPGGSFCPTDEYRLQLSGDGRSIQGQNMIWQAPCQGSSRVWLQRTQ